MSLNNFLIIFSVVWPHWSNYTRDRLCQTCDFSRHLRSQGPFQVSARPWGRGYFEQSKMVDGQSDVWSTSRYVSPHSGVTIGLTVPKSKYNVHWLQVVEFMAWLKAGRPVQVEEMTRQLEAGYGNRDGNLPLPAHPTSWWSNQWMNLKVSR